MEISKICKNCRHLKEMKSPYVGCNYHYCTYGNLAPNVNPEDECINFPWAFEPTDDLLLKLYKNERL